MRPPAARGQRSSGVSEPDGTNEAAPARVGRPDFPARDNGNRSGPRTIVHFGAEARARAVRRCSRGRLALDEQRAHCRPAVVPNVCLARKNVARCDRLPSARLSSFEPASMVGDVDEILIVGARRPPSRQTTRIRGTPRCLSRQLMPREETEPRDERAFERLGILARSRVCPVINRHQHLVARATS